MFCFKCGDNDQVADSYCRRCGTFLPNPDRLAKKIISPAEHVTANLVLSVLTIVASFTLSALLFLLVAFREGTHPLIYVTAGVLITIGSWQVQTVWRSWQLRKHFRSFPRSQEDTGPAVVTDKLLNTSARSDVVPASVTERTTHKLSK